MCMQASRRRLVRVILHGDKEENVLLAPWSRWRKFCQALHRLVNLFVGDTKYSRLCKTACCFLLQRQVSRSKDASEESDIEQVHNSDTKMSISITCIQITIIFRDTSLQRAV